MVAQLVTVCWVSHSGLLLQIYLSKTQHGHSMPGVRGHGGGQVAITIILGWGLVTYCACVNTVFAEKARNVMED